VPTALVTGATAGIGLAFARELAARGDDVVLVARDRNRLDAVAGDLAARHGVRTEVLAADLTDPAAVQEVAARLSDPDRPVDLLVNSAGFSLRRPFLENPVEDEVRMFDLLCRAVLVLSHAAARSMVQRGSGAIVNVSSIAGYVPMGTYSAAKSWVTVFSEGLARDLTGTGVTVTALCPGYTHTELHQRAGIKMGWLPERFWQDADTLVRHCLDDVAKGRVISISGMGYTALAGLIQLVPRPLLRRSGGSISRHRRGG
jgi:short-subunit dehydrogenase